MLRSPPAGRQNCQLEFTEQSFKVQIRHWQVALPGKEPLHFQNTIHSERFIAVTPKRPCATQYNATHLSAAHGRGRGSQGHPSSCLECCCLICSHQAHCRDGAKAGEREITGLSSKHVGYGWGEDHLHTSHVPVDRRAASQQPRIAASRQSERKHMLLSKRSRQPELISA